MSTLQELQKQFVDALDQKSETIFPWVKASAQMTEKNHFAIYRDSIKGIKQKVLQDVYPICCSIVGEEYFIAMCNAYISNTISESADLGDYVIKFPDFVAHFTPIKSLPYVADVTRLELACFQLENAKKNQVLDFEKLSACYVNDGDNIVFTLPENATLIQSQYPIHLIWQMHQHAETDTTVKMAENENYFFLVWRDDEKLRIDYLTQPQSQLLTWIQQRFTLGKIAEITEFDLNEVLPTLIQGNWLRGFYI